MSPPDDAADTALPSHVHSTANCPGHHHDTGSANNSSIKENATEGAPRRILIVRPSALGDVARTVPALVTLRLAFPDARIDWLVAQRFADTVQHHPMLDGVIAWDRHFLGKMLRGRANPWHAVTWLHGLRRADYDHVYDLQGLLRSGLLALATGAPHRVGFSDAREGGWIGCNVRHHAPQRHTVDRMLGLLQADGLRPVGDMRLYLGEQDRHFLHTFLEHHQIERGYACLAPTARWLCKCWPIEKFAQIAQRLLETRIAGERLVILASPREQDQIRPLVDLLPLELQSRVILPVTRVGEMMALLSQTRLLIANDSAPLHIAVGFDRPIVAIFGPTDPTQVGPYHCQSSVIQPDIARQLGPRDFNYRRRRHDQTLIAQVEPETVWQIVQSTLQSVAPGKRNVPQDVGRSA